MSLPVIDLSHVNAECSKAIGRACHEFGFFYVVNHNIAPELIRSLEDAARKFFSLPLPEKMKIEMRLGGRAWRGYFPIGGELTSGRPDNKEGLYFGEELDDQDPRVVAGLPLHGRNLFPESLPELRPLVLQYMEQCAALGHRIMELIALSLGLPRDYFRELFSPSPTPLFRLFNYPPLSEEQRRQNIWGVGEHTDYGILTILKQDTNGGLEIKSSGQWLEAPPIEGSFVCNLGDMLDKMTGGLYRSTPHRVRHSGHRYRLSLPYFFDPAFTAQMKPIDPTRQTLDDGESRWDKKNVHEFSGTYGDYLIQKVIRVFPELQKKERIG